MVAQDSLSDPASAAILAPDQRKRVRPRFIDLRMSKDISCSMQTLAERIRKHNAVRFLVDFDRATDAIPAIGEVERRDVVSEKALEAVLGIEHELTHAGVNTVRAEDERERVMGAVGKCYAHIRALIFESGDCCAEAHLD